MFFERFMKGKMGMNNSTKVIKVEPNNNVFKEIGKNNYSEVELLGELIDNSIGGRTDEQMNGEDILEVELDIIVYEGSKPKFRIRDNGTGISFKELGVAIAPAGTSGGKDINEHGFGMKQAVAALGDLECLKTSVMNEDTAYVVKEFKYGDVPATGLSEDSNEHYTELVINNCNEILSIRERVITESVVPLLGAKYRRYLRPNDPKVEIKMKLIDGDKSSDTREWEVKEVHPEYFHPSTRENKPIIEKKTIKGKGWEIKLTYGVAPTPEEYEVLDINKPKKYNPYNVSMSKQGLDIIKDDRIINFHQLSEIGLVEKAHPQYNSVRGEIELVKGFTTATAKNFVPRDTNWNNMIQKVKEYLTSRGYLTGKRTSPTAIPEKVFRDRLASYFKTSVVNSFASVEKEVSVGELNGSIDILTVDEEGKTGVWELKRDPARGLDVFQCFAYVTMGGYDEGYLVSPEFPSGVEEAIKFVKKNYKVDIKKVPFKEFPIKEPMSKEELAKYGY